MKPSIGRVVHYVSYGTPGGEYGKECRAAIVTEVNGDRSIPHDEGLSPEGTSLCGGKAYDGGTWHWPARVN